MRIGLGEFYARVGEVFSNNLGFEEESDFHQWENIFKKNL